MKEGKTAGKHCSVCKTVTLEQKVVPATGQHSWDEGKITKEPTKTEEGIKTYTCTSCKTTKTSNIAATGHTKELRNVKTATCAHAGYTGDTYCKDCNAKLS